MNIGMDAAPLLGSLISGVGWCEANLTEALTRLHPELNSRFEYFTIRGENAAKETLRQFQHGRIGLHRACYSPLLYRMLPLPYRWFHGDWADITHFYNYIVPPGVSEKTVVTVHDMVYRAYPETMRLRTRLLLEAKLKRSMKRTDCIITDSEFSRKEIAKYMPQFAHKVHVVPCGVDCKRFAPVSGKKLMQIKRRLHLPDAYFLYLGTLEPRKNLVRLLRAYAQLRKKKPDAPPLLLAGGKGWQYKEIFAAANQLALRDNVRFLDYLAEEDLAAVYSGAVAFVFPSLYEGFGLPPLEAMACGTPVLTSNAASLPEVVGDAALLCDPRSVSAIAKGMQRLLEDANLRETLRQRGFTRAQEMSWENAAEKLYAVYMEMRNS